jgi:hypothetical protein
MNTTGILGHQGQLKKLNSYLASERVPQALVLSGIRGIGKKIIGRRFLSAIFCEAETAPCLECKICRSVEKGIFHDYIELLPDEKGKIPIGDSENPQEGSVRWMIEYLSRASISGRYGVLIDDADRLSVPAQNALLKIIEEPPDGTCIVMIASNSRMLLPTILSRSKTIEFQPLSDQDILHILSSSMNNPLSSSLSAGSMEIADMLNSEKNLEELFHICAAIAGTMNESRPLAFDISNFIKLTGPDLFLCIMSNIYRRQLISCISDTKQDLPDSLLIRDPEKLRFLVKIFLALERGIPNNLNIKNVLKSFLYNSDSRLAHIPININKSYLENN